MQNRLSDWLWEQPVADKSADFFSGILRKYVPLIAISLLVTFLYGGIILHMFPYFSPANMSWEGHLSGGIMGTLCAFGFLNHGPQRPEPFADETDE